MRPPAIDVRLFLDAPGESWAYVVKRSGEVIAATDGDDHFSSIGEALKAALADASDTLQSKKKGVGHAAS